MKKLKLARAISSTLVVASILALNPIGASAEWKQDSNGWWYTEGDSWATAWREISGNWYYFDSNGYMLHDTNVGDYKLGSDGSWINTQTQSQKISVVYPSNWIKKTSKNGKDIYYLDDKGTTMTLISADMGGYSEKDYLQRSCENLKKQINLNTINISKQTINDNTVDVLDYTLNYEGANISTHLVIFYNNNMAYIFAITESNSISDSNMNAFNNTLNTVTFANR